MSVSASSSARDPPLADPGALHDPFVRRVDERRQLVVRQHAIGHVHAEAGDADPASVGDADHCSASPTANVSVPRTASSPSTVARALPRPIGPPNGLERALQRQFVAGPDNPLEADVVDAGEEREPPAVLLLGQHRDGAGLRERLDHLHARHDRVPRKVACAVLVGHALARDDARAWLELDDLVEKQKGRAMGEDLFDCLPPEGGRRGHAGLV